MFLVMWGLPKRRGNHLENLEDTHVLYLLWGAKRLIINFPSGNFLGTPIFCGQTHVGQLRRETRMSLLDHL